MPRALIIGKHTRELSLLTLSGADLSSHQLDDIYQLNRPTVTGYTAVEQCNGSDELFQALDRLVAVSGQIEILDIVDHGAQGAIMLGDHVLLQHDGKALATGADVISRLARYLTDTAQFRLLGCTTALGTEGQGMLLSVAKLLGGHRVVLGTLERVFANNFSATEGFLLEHDLLYSSLAAVDFLAPDQGARNKSILRNRRLVPPSDLAAAMQPAVVVDGLAATTRTQCTVCMPRVVTS